MGSKSETQSSCLCLKVAGAPLFCTPDASVLAAMAAPGDALVSLTQDGYIRKQIVAVGDTGLEKPYDGDYCVGACSFLTSFVALATEDDRQFQY